MTTDDDVRSALDLLARRADALPAPDRVPAVRRRARRAAQVRTAALAAAAVVVLAATGTLVRGGQLLGSGPAGGGVEVTPSDGPPHLDVDVAPETDPVVLRAAQTGPYGSNGFRLVVLSVRIRGSVPAAKDGSTPYGVYYEQADHSSGGSRAPGCAAGAELVPVDRDELVTLTYEPGTTLTGDRVTITVAACAPVEPVVRTLTVTVPPAASPTGG